MAQKVAKKVDIAEMEKLSDEYLDIDILAHTLITEFEFSYNENSKKIEVEEKHIEYYASLTGKPEEVLGHNYYDDYSKISKISGSKAESNTNKMKIDGIFHHDMYDYYYYFDIEDANKIYKVEYQKEHFDARYLTTEYFQLHYPILHRSIIFRIPNNIKVELKEMNFDGYNISKEVSIENDDRIITYKLENIEPFPRYGNSPGASFYAPHILILTKEIVDENNNVKAIVMRNTQDQYDWYKSLVVKANNDPSDLHMKVNELTKDCENDKMKMETLFYWVQENINYIAYEDGISGFQPDNCQNVIYNRYGDCKGMANLLTEMLKNCNIDARLTWIGTNSIAYDYSIPSLAVDNHAICTVILDGEYYFLDATEKFIGLDDYAERIQGRPALIEDDESYIIKKVPTYSYERNYNFTEMIFEINEMMLNGSINMEYNGESNSRLMNSYHSLYDDYKEKAINHLIISGDNNIHVDSIRSVNFDKRGKTIKLYSKVHIENKVSQFGDNLYVDWDLYKEFNDYTIDSTRTVDYILNRKIYTSNETHFKTPSGYRINEFPENYKLVNEEFIIDIKFDYSESNQSLRIIKEIIIPNAKISKENFAEWNDGIKTLKEKYKTVIIYEKI